MGNVAHHAARRFELVWAPAPDYGKIVRADIQLRGEQDESEGRRAIKRYCSEHIEPFKVPLKIQFVQGGLDSDRLKRLRVGRETRTEAPAAGVAGRAWFVRAPWGIRPQISSDDAK